MERDGLFGWTRRLRCFRLSLITTRAPTLSLGSALDFVSGAFPALAQAGCRSVIAGVLETHTSARGAPTDIKRSDTTKPSAEGDTPVNSCVSRLGLWPPPLCPPVAPQRHFLLICLSLALSWRRMKATAAGATAAAAGGCRRRGSRVFHAMMQYLLVVLLSHRFAPQRYSRGFYLNSRSYAMYIKNTIFCVGIVQNSRILL